jgi:PKD repeat protein
VTNKGPYSAPGVVLTDVLDANLSYVSASKSQGASSRSGSVVTFNFGSLGVGQTVTASVTAQAIDSGNLTDTATVASSIAEAHSADNTAIVTTAVAEAPIVVSGAISVSGKNQSNVKVATFTHANGVEPASAFIATVNWGDGSTSAGTITQSGTTYTVKGSHTYAKNGTYTVTTTVVEPGGGPASGADADDMYVWDIAAENRTRGNKQDARVDVVVRSDSNTDGQPGSSDAVVAGAKVTVQLFTVTGALVGTDSGKTDADGIFTSSWFNSLPAGTYVAEVLAVEDDSFRWNKSLDSSANISDIDGDNLPDQQFNVQGTAAAKGPLLGIDNPVASYASSTQAALPEATSGSSLKPESVDLVFSAPALKRNRHRLHDIPENMSHDAIDRIFTLS